MSRTRSAKGEKMRRARVTYKNIDGTNTFIKPARAREQADNPPQNQSIESFDEPAMCGKQEEEQK